MSARPVVDAPLEEIKQVRGTVIVMSVNLFLSASEDWSLLAPQTASVNIISYQISESFEASHEEHGKFVPGDSLTGMVADGINAEQRMMSNS